MKATFSRPGLTAGRWLLSHVNAGMLLDGHNLVLGLEDGRKGSREKCMSNGSYGLASNSASSVWRRPETSRLGPCGPSFPRANRSVSGSCKQNKSQGSGPWPQHTSKP